MKGWFIYSGYFWSDSTHFILDKFSAEFEKQGCPVKIFKSNEITFYCDKNGDVKCLGGFEKPDFAVFWDKDLPLAKMLEKWGVKLYNSAAAIEICDSKILTHIALSNSGVKMPETVCAPLVFNTCTEKDDTFINNLLKILSFPIVIKETNGSFGQQVYLAKNLDELKAVRQRLLHIPHLYQQFVSSSSGKDIRIVVLNGKVIASMMRHNDHDFRSNIELGGNVAQYELPESFAVMAEKVSKIIGLDFCGVDLLIGDDGSPLLCEVNSNPYFRGIMKSTGINVVGLYVSYILSKNEKR